jgi:hypothetical protein
MKRFHCNSFNNVCGQANYAGLGRAIEALHQTLVRNRPKIEFGFPKINN